MTSIEDRHTDLLVHLSLRTFIDTFDNFMCIAGHQIGLFLEAVHHLLINLLCNIVKFASFQTVLRNGEVHSKDFEEALTTTCKVIVFKDIANAVPYHIGNVHTDTLSHQGVTTLLVDDGTLFVHHIIVLQQTLTNAEMVLFNFLLCALDALRNHRMFYHLTILEAQAVHDLGNTLGCKQTHQLVFQRNVEDRTTRVSLTS